MPEIQRDAIQRVAFFHCVESAIFRFGGHRRDAVDEHLNYMLSRVPLGRLATTDEAANLVAFLASEAMSFSTGAAFDLSGGRLTY